MDPKFVEMMEQLQDAVSKLGDPHEHFRKAAKVFEDLAPTLERLKEVTENATPNSIEIGKAGWTIPFWMTFGDIYQAHLALQRSPADLAKFYEEFYETDYGKEYLQALLESCAESEALSQWRQLIQEAAYSFSEERYKICVPALLSVIEGAFIKVHGDLRARRSMPYRVAESMVVVDQESLGEALDGNMIGFILALYGDAPFADPEPELLNRHWVLHGRSSGEWGRLDAIRLFQALEYWALF